MTSNIASIIGKMNRRRGAVERELGGAARTLALELGAEAKRVMQDEIYNVPEKRSTSGRKAWRRTGNLKRSERARAEGVVIVLSNSANYAAARHALGTKDSSREPISPQRSVQWEDQAVLNKRGRILSVRRAAVMKALVSP